MRGKSKHTKGCELPRQAGCCVELLRCNVFLVYDIYSLDIYILVCTYSRL
jgi:hypothetical protein